MSEVKCCFTYAFVSVNLTPSFKMTNCCLPEDTMLHTAFFTVAQEKYDIFIIHPVIWQDPIFPHPLPPTHMRYSPLSL